MSYAADTDAAEQCAQGEEHGRGAKQTDFDLMCQYHDMTPGEFSQCSISEQAQMRWNWRTFGRKEGK